VSQRKRVVGKPNFVHPADSSTFERKVFNTLLARLDLQPGLRSDQLEIGAIQICTRVDQGKWIINREVS